MLDNREAEIIDIVGDLKAFVTFSYNPELEDELEILVGDVVNIKKKSGGWCFVENINGEQGWVPESYLNEVSVNDKDIMDSDNNTLVRRGTVQMDYQSRGSDGFSVKKDDDIQIYKKVNNWLDCEINGLRGWVPCWYVRVDKPLVEETNNEDLQDMITKLSINETIETAVGIYPYTPEREDELKIVVGTFFNIKSKTGGWCYAQQDNQEGWVPENCLLKTKVNGRNTIDGSQVGKGEALVDFKSKTGDSFIMNKGDQLRLLKLENRWLYCWNNENGVFGWAPSWFVRIDRQVPGDPTTQYSTSPMRASAGNPQINTHYV